MQIRNRIKELRQVKASELLPNPRNWRTHPSAQVEALKGVLAEIGYADALIAYETDEGLMLIDGHLRAETTPDMEVPVLVTDLDEGEAGMLLATLDPLAAMAGKNEGRLTELLATVSSSNDMVNNLLSTLTDSLLSVNPYAQTVNIPIYTPTGPQPSIDELRDRQTADKLVDEIRQADLPVDIQQFLLDAAERHVAFNYERIANYYAHAPANIQALMERSALVIIDYEQAIENGFIRLVEEIDAAFYEDYPHA